MAIQPPAPMLPSRAGHLPALTEWAIEPKGDSIPVKSSRDMRPESDTSTSAVLYALDRRG